MDSYINIRSLNLDELVGVVSLYPWYGAARVELSRRMARLGGDSWGKSQYADAALYVASRRRIADLLRDRSADYSDKDLEKLLGSYIKEEEKPSDKRKVRVVGRGLLLSGGVRQCASEGGQRILQVRHPLPGRRKGRFGRGTQRRVLHRDFGENL